eukprot:2239319-Prymnesium_polylepis.1
MPANAAMPANPAMPAVLPSHAMAMGGMVVPGAGMPMMAPPLVPAVMTPMPPMMPYPAVPMSPAMAPAM